MTDINQVWPDRSGFTAPVPTQSTRSLEHLSDIQQIADLAILVKSNLSVVAGSRHPGCAAISQLSKAREKMNEILRLTRKIQAEA